MKVANVTRDWGRAIGIAAISIFLVAFADEADAQETVTPPQVTDSSVARGKEVYKGPANCVGCHGESGQGTENGPSLVDGKWLRGSGTYEEILDQVLHGTRRQDSKTGNPMPVRGWIPASDAEVQAVAAYVWWLSHQSAARKPPG